MACRQINIKRQSSVNTVRKQAILMARMEGEPCGVYEKEEYRGKPVYAAATVKEIEANGFTVIETAYP